MAENFEGEVIGFPQEIILNTDETSTPNYVVSVNGEQGAVIVTPGDSGNAVHYTAQTPTSAEKLIARTNIGVGEGDTPSLSGLQIRATNGADEVMVGLNATNNTSVATDWRVAVMGMNLQVTEGGAGYVAIDDTSVGWAWGFETNFLDADGVLQNEIYLTTQGSERPLVGGFSPSVQVNVTGMTNPGGNTTQVTFTAHSTITDYLFVGMRVRFTSLTNPTGAIALNTFYKVLSIVSPTSFIIGSVGGANIVGDADSGVMDRGGWGNMAYTVPFSVRIGDTAASNYLTTQIFGEAISSLENAVSGHGATLIIRNVAADQFAALRLMGDNGTSDWSWITLDHLVGPDLCLYENAPLNDFRIVIKSGGKVGIGTTAPAAKLDLLSTTEQLRLSYNAANYAAFTVASSGDLTIDPTGAITLAASGVTLSNLTSNGLVTTSGGTGTLSITVPASGVLTWLATPSSANLRSVITDETGTGALVFATQPTFTDAAGAGVNFSSAHTTETGTSASIALVGNSLTTGTGLYLASSSLTTGSLLDIAITGTAGDTAQKGINVSLSGANAGVSVTTKGIVISNTHTGTTGTNTALELTASGGTTNNAINVVAGGSALQTATATSLALGGATIGSNALAVTGTSAFSSTIIGSGNITSASSIFITNAASTLVIGAASPDSAQALKKFTKKVTAFSNATPKVALTITIPNAAHSANVAIRLCASLGAGGTVGANESSASISYDVVVTKTAGANCNAAISAAYGSTGSTGVASSDTCAVTAAVTLASATSVTVDVTITRGGGTSDNHTCLVSAEIQNANGSGITIT